jgi:hypothetical protein
MELITTVKVFTISLGAAFTRLILTNTPAYYDTKLITTVIFLQYHQATYTRQTLAITPAYYDTELIKTVK